MLTGFYELNNIIKDRNILKQFYQEAVMLSYYTNVQKIVDYRRVSTNEKSIVDIINMLDIDKIFKHLVCIDRSVQNENELKGEVGINVIDENGNDYFLFSDLTLLNLRLLTAKYGLIMK